MDRRCVVVLIGLLLSLTLVSGPVLADGPEGIPEDVVVHLVYFYAEDCPHCKVAYEEIIQPLQARCESHLEVQPVEIGTAQGYEAFIATERALTGETGRWDIPTAVLGAQIYMGEEPVRERLESDVECALLAGGADWPNVPELQAVVAPMAGSLGESANPFAGTTEGVESCIPSEDEAAAVCAAPEPIYVLYFSKPGCQECERTLYALGYLQQRFPQLVIEKCNVLEDAALAEWLGEQYAVPETQRLVAPAVIVGDAYLVGASLGPDTLLATVERYAVSGAAAIWEAWTPGEGEAAIEERFRSLGVFTIIGAGLLDGLNPCAFATLIFFVSYLTLMNRTGKEILFVGAAFALGIFTTYLLVGVGLWKTLSALPFLAQIGQWLYGITAVICAALAIFSFLDYLKARRGELQDMTLALSHSLRQRINAIIRRYRNRRGFVISAFVTGALVSLVELACTGQVYLPTILFVLSVPELRARGYAYLVLYNLMFIVPLIVVFVLVYFGTTSKQLTAFLQQRAATVKLGLALLFAILSAWLVTLVV